VDGGRLRKWEDEEVGEAVGEGGEATRGVEWAVVGRRGGDMGEGAADGVEGGRRGRGIVDGHCIMVGLCV